ncbi:hypothetical protein vseg_008656 [Gypsophila vaccaria]
MTSPTVISSPTPTPTPTPTRHLSLLSPTRLLTPFPTLTPRTPRSRAVPQLRCEVALRSDSPAGAWISDAAEEDAEVKAKVAKVGSRARVKSPMKFHHVPKAGEVVEITPEMEGLVKQYVGVWKGKRITATYPFKVEFSLEVHGRGLLKFVAHLKEDEFDFIG